MGKNDLRSAMVESNRQASSLAAVIYNIMLAVIVEHEGIQHSKIKQLMVVPVIFIWV